MGGQQDIATIYSVDSSESWVGSVRSSIGAEGRLRIKWVDLGPLGDWGRPLDYRSRARFPDYTNWIWEQEQSPDCVLVDGRFRVACFLTSILRAGAGTQIIFDDYTNRPHYHIVEDIVTRDRENGRQAFFIARELDADTRARAEKMLSEFRHVMD